MRAFRRLSDTSKHRRDESGIALFMVLSAIGILALLVTEFTYVAQLNQRMAFDSLDQLQSHYLAKTGFKISLLRLKAYQQVKSLISKNAPSGTTAGAAASAMIPASVLEQIWSFPFVFPIPSEIPGLSLTEKQAIEKFGKESGLNGTFTAVIESESSKFNLNSLLASYAYPQPSPSPSASRSPSPGGSPSPSPSPSASAAAFDPNAAREALSELIASILEAEFKKDPALADEYRDFQLQDLMDNLIAWADRTYEKRNTSLRELVPRKGAPFYSVSELHLIHPLDDRLYDLLAQNFTVAPSPGLNVNAVQAPLLRALVPSMTDEEADAFFAHRDSTDADNKFKSEAEFLTWLKDNVAAFSGSDDKVAEFKQTLASRNIRIVTEESIFKISVEATVNQSRRILEAWVTLVDNKSTAGGTPANRIRNNGSSALSGSGASDPDASGLRVLFMRFL